MSKCEPENPRTVGRTDRDRPGVGRKQQDLLGLAGMPGGGERRGLSAASHQRRCLSIGLHHPHPAPSSPSGSIISIRLHHLCSITSIRFHHFHPAPSSPSPPSGSIILHWVTSSPSGSITSIQLHHPHRAPSNCIISTGLHHLHRAPSGPTVTVTQGGERNLAMREQCHPKWTEDTVSSGGVGEFLAAAELC